MYILYKFYSQAVTQRHVIITSLSDVLAGMGKKKKKANKKSISYYLVDSTGYFERLIYLPSLKVEGTWSRGNGCAEEEATLIYVIFKVFGLWVTLWALKLK